MRNECSNNESDVIEEKVAQLVCCQKLRSLEKKYGMKVNFQMCLWDGVQEQVAQLNSRE